MDVITVQDCIDMLLYKNKTVILNDGAVMGFQEEEDGYKKTDRYHSGRN